MSAPLLSVKAVGPQSDFEALLDRMRQRQYPETIPVLASFWLKTVYAAGHKRAWWKELHELIRHAIAEEPLTDSSCEALEATRGWIERNYILTHRIPQVILPQVEPFRADLKREQLAAYIGRMLNEWLPAEVARLLVAETEAGTTQENALPIMGVGRALEQLLVRERLSPATLEMILESGFLSPRYVYPADAEMLRDVLSYLLGRTRTTPLPVMPAILLGVDAESPLPPDYRVAVERAWWALRNLHEEVRVPIAASHAARILQSGRVRIASTILTMDGRWWESENLESGHQHTVIYKPIGRLRIDYTEEHMGLAVPWPDTRHDWSGQVHFQDSFEIFGREWHPAGCEINDRGTWLRLVSSRALPMAKIQPALNGSFQRSRLAEVDMAWAALENAVAASLAQKNCEPVEQLRRCEFIPLGRAIVEMALSMKSIRPPKQKMMEIQLNAIRYQAAEISLNYGRLPWRVLPPPTRAVLVRRRPDAVLRKLLHEVFEGLPDTLDATGPARSPSQAA